LAVWAAFVNVKYADPLLSSAVFPASSVDWTAKKYVVLSVRPVRSIA